MITRSRRLTVLSDSVAGILNRSGPAAEAEGAADRPWGGAVPRRVWWLWAGAVAGLALAAVILVVWGFSAEPGFAGGGGGGLKPTAHREQGPLTPTDDFHASDVVVDWVNVSIAAVSAAGGMMSGLVAVYTARRSMSSVAEGPPALPDAPSPSIGSAPASSDPPATSGRLPTAPCRRERSSPRLCRHGRYRPSHRWQGGCCG
ncbi:hypothetical protein SUDANB120_06430 (plasmid) [Streptomyces sp. enrichment culture]